ncbi:MAG: aryl-sulfate sulfotransferase [Bacteroidetes bacterium]|nr:aryl-sulfate sulfotransferase [Bacteroidota bacterium]
MNIGKIKTLLQILLIVMMANYSFAQTQTMGVFVNDTANAYKGYLLLAPKQYTKTYLINNEGRKLHEWTASTYAPGQAVYLLENGNLLRTCMTQGNLGTGGGEGGRIEEYNWNDSLIWWMNYSTTTYMQHHDIKKLPNGNIIMLVVEKKTVAQVEAAGFDTTTFQQPDFSQKKCILPDCIVEIQPTYPSGGTVVWEWHVWDHLIQNHDATKSNYGTPSAHPELIDCAGDHRTKPIFWNHMNSIDYNPTFDQIALSVRGNSEVWVVDHSTTTAQATGHTGGTRGKGGDLIYRWGNPLCYGAGTSSNQKYFEQHDVEWIKPGCPGAGDLLCFNNGVNRNYSTIDQFTPAADASGNYTIVSGSAYAPANLSWTYQATPPTSMYTGDISGAQRLPNGNTIICVGPTGTLYEVTAAGQVVWKYIGPVTNLGPLTQGDSIPHNPDRPFETMNSIFRVYKYAPTYAAFNGKVITPGAFLEIYTTSVNEKSINTPEIKAYPNPFTDKINLTNINGKEEYGLTDMLGQLVWNGKQIEEHNFSGIRPGLYFLKVKLQNSSKTIKLIKQ